MLGHDASLLCCFGYVVFHSKLIFMFTMFFHSKVLTSVYHITSKSPLRPKFISVLYCLCDRIRANCLIENHSSIFLSDDVF